MKKGSLTPQFEQFVAQIKKGPDASEFKTTTQNITMSEINYESIGPFLEETTGVGVLFTDLPEVRINFVTISTILVTACESTDQFCRVIS